ncbi:nitrogenase [Chroococcidiopsis sp. CCALA 051]|uniref:Mo-dependent nitrogenase C-terminal domain-containing protein n=1 Tax=Chroococcidiopsis sp. CCALA 051 TaxID=869949 RepID=UPI000D0D9D86|nr:nitrogenase [Chroococcidiopsis sp. CCALA 051]
MTNLAISPNTQEQIEAWLRGLLAVAWADGDFEAHERELIPTLALGELKPTDKLSAMTPITVEELAAALGQNQNMAENFLRTAVMVAIADGTYSTPEDDLLHQFCHALGLQDNVLVSLRHTLCDLGDRPQDELGSHPYIDVLHPVRDWLDGLEIHDPKVAHFLCKMIPPQCPFERDIKLFGHKVVHIPPLCKLNPLYEQLVGLRFRALSYLADDCGEDVSEYI